MRAKYGDMTEEEFNKERERLKKEQDAKKNETNGAVAQRAAIESQERALRIKFDGIMAVLSGKLNAMVLKFIPMVTNALSFITNNMPVIEGAFKALAIAIGVLAGAAGIGKVVSTVRAVKDGINKIFGRDSGPIGSPGNPAHIKFSDGLPDLPGGSGGKIATKAKYFGMTKKEYQENLKKALLSGKSKAQFREESDVLYKKLLGAGLITKSGHRTNKPWFDVDAPNSVIEKATAPVQSGVITKTTAPVQARAIGKTKSPVQSRVIGKTKSPVQPGESVGGALGELVDSLKYASKNAGAIIKGGAALGTALVAVGGGAAGAIWIVGKALPTFAKGMQSFNDVNGKNLAGVGIGLAGIGAGILELGAGTVFDAINGLAGVFGVKSPLERAADQLIAFQKLPINAEKVKANGEASMAFAKALAGATVINEFSEVASSISDFFKKEPPFQKFVYFSNLDINAKKTKNNATAFRYFADAMASYTGTSAVASFSNALSDATVRFFKASPPLEKFAYFSKLDINAKKTKNNATAFRYFSEALNQYKGVGTNIIGELSNLIGSAINKLFNQEGPIDAFENFTKRQFGSNGSKNAEAFFKFATSIGLLMGTASSNSWGDIGSGLLNVAGEVVGTAAGAIGGVVGGVAATVGGLLGKIIKAESGGNPNAAAKTSSAYGLGQFTKGTFEGIAKEKGSPVYGVTWEQYKKDANIQMKALEYLTTKNQQFLSRSGIPVTSASTYLAHFLGPAGARNIYKYPDNAALNQVVGAAAYNANRSVFDKAKTVGGLKAWASKKMGDPVRQAKEGGIFTGPKSGYPMELHGTEIVIPMDRNSLLTKLSQNNANNMEAMITAMNAARENASAASGMPMPGVDNLVADRVIELDNEMRNLLLVKLNRMITVLDGRHDTAKRILRNVKA